MNFTYCFDEETKQELINNGLKFLKEEIISNKKAFVFISNDNAKVLFNNKKVYCTNRLNF